ncbi:ribosome silencing factor [Tropicibacter naphthalenivorans]
MANAASAAERGQPMPGVTQNQVTSAEILALVLETLSDNKAEDVVQIDLRGKSAVCDHMVICSGRSSRQVAAISEKVSEELKQKLGVLCKMEGKETGDWVLIDSGDVVLHVFRPEVREFYQLEKMWVPSAPGAQA